jgi:hypothetical protein
MSFFFFIPPSAEDCPLFVPAEGGNVLFLLAK